MRSFSRTTQFKRDVKRAGKRGKALEKLKAVLDLLIAGDELPAPYKFSEEPQSCTRLANGNTIFTSRGGGGKGPQLIEVTPDKKVVWVLQDWKTVGSASAVQILDDPGIPENPGESEH